MTCRTRSAMRARGWTASTVRFCTRWRSKQRRKPLLPPPAALALAAAGALHRGGISFLVLASSAVPLMPLLRQLLGPPQLRAMTTPAPRLQLQRERQVATVALQTTPLAAVVEEGRSSSGLVLTVMVGTRTSALRAEC